MSQSARQQQQRQPASDQSAPGVIAFEGFSGLQTQPTRYGIGDQECFVMDGFFPAGNSNARTIYDNGPAVYTPPSSSIGFFDFGNIGSSPLAIVILADGSVISVNTDTEVATELAGPGTILAGVGISQWGSQYILIVADQANGYFVTDGTNFYSAGQVIPAVTGAGPIASSFILDQADEGSGYVVGDTGIIIGGVNDATYVITAVNDDGSGLNYAIGDTGFVNAGNRNATYIIDTVDGLGAVVTMHLTAAGTFYTTSTFVPTENGGAQPGSGTGLTLNITTGTNGAIVGFTLTLVGLVTGYTVTNPGTHYVTGRASTSTGGAQPGSGKGLVLDLTVTSATMPTGIQGSAIETYQSRVWIVSGSSLIWSSPESFTDFSTANGGGSLISNDSTLRARYVRLRQSNGYLYLFGDSSISYIAGVQTTGSPPTTTFSLQNADPEVGTNWPNTVDVLGSNIVFANPWGAHVSFGGRSAKVSAELDGIYNSLPNFGGGIPSAGKAIVFGKRVWVLLLPVIDSYTGQQIDKMFLWDEKRWCSTQQSAAIFFVQAQEIDSVITCWGTDGASIYRLFQRPTTNVRKVIRSKFWAPFSLFFSKGEERVTGLATILSGPDVVVTVCLDTENGSSCSDITLTSPQLTWYQDSLLPPAPGALVLPWTGAGGLPLVWMSNGNNAVVFPPTGDLANNGALIGLTLSTFAADLALSSVQTIPATVQGRF